MKLVKKTITKDGRNFTNVYLITDNDVKIPIQVKKFGKNKQDYFRECTLIDSSVEE